MAGALDQHVASVTSVAIDDGRRDAARQSRRVVPVELPAIVHAACSSARTVSGHHWHRHGRRVLVSPCPWVALFSRCATNL
ncbi:hypothetical protein AURDEDRAFT_111565 [Auricularia subglabra TFB-10046 SS5]|nr:hypothetical protein AURDEDRAFT_111565 [Auricularia subglabra TFB-10046 SS5]